MDIYCTSSRVRRKKCLNPLIMVVRSDANNAIAMKKAIVILLLRLNCLEDRQVPSVSSSLSSLQ